MRAQISLEALIGLFIIVLFFIILLGGIAPQIKRHNELIQILRCKNKVNRDLIIIDYLSMQCKNCVVNWAFEMRGENISCANISKRSVGDIKKNIFGEIYEK